MTRPTIEVPTELYMALVRLLDIIPPILEDWTATTGFGEVFARDSAALVSVRNAIALHHEWLAEAGVKVEAA
jgi:hypothetical protein